MDKELHLFLIWQNGRRLEEKILTDIAGKLEIVKTYNISWSEANFADNLTRFYGKKLPRGCKKIKECGTGDFLLILVYDHNPCYYQGVNTNLTSRKYTYRQWFGGGYLVHASDSLREANENLLFLLGKTVRELASEITEPWNKSHTGYKRDLVGATGWNSLDEVLAIARKVPETTTEQKGNRPVIRTPAPDLMRRLLNAQKACWGLRRNLYNIKINGQKFPLEIQALR